MRHRHCGFGAGFLAADGGALAGCWDAWACGGASGVATEMLSRHHRPLTTANTRSKLICNGRVGNKPVSRSNLLASSAAMR